MSSQHRHIGGIAATIIPVAAQHDVVPAWQAALRLVSGWNFGSEASHYIATSVSELAQNLVSHATSGGTITISPIRREETEGVEIVAQDGGPGIAGLPRAMGDGYSTNGGLGTGLSAVKRMMNEFEITSTVGTGTRVVTRMWKT